MSLIYFLINASKSNDIVTIVDIKNQIEKWLIENVLMAVDKDSIANQKDKSV